MSADQLGNNADIDRRVDEFIEAIVLRDKRGAIVEVRLSEMEMEYIRHGRKPPTVPTRLQDALSKFFSSKDRHDRLKFEMALLKQYPKRISSLDWSRAADNYRERQKTLSFVEQLKLSACAPESNPTEATLVAKMYLDGTFDTPRDPTYARELLIEAAGHGNAEAAYLLATSRNVSDIHRRLKAPLVISPFLIKDEKQRQHYLHQARVAKYEKVFDDEEQMRRDKKIRIEVLDSHLPDNLAERLERDSDYIGKKEQYLANLEAAKSGDANAQCEVGKALLDMSDCALGLILFASGRQSGPAELAQKLKGDKEEAREWLLNAARQSCEAKFVLAKRFEDVDENRFALLVSAAFPENGSTPYRLALSPLACEFYMNPASKYHDVKIGLKCLNAYLHYYMPMSLDIYGEISLYGDLYEEANGHPLNRNQSASFGLLEEDVAAALCIADYWRNASPSEEQELSTAFWWYGALACNVPNSAYAALNAGLMAKRGEGTTLDLKAAKYLLEIARDAEFTDKRNDRASRFADVVLRLRFEEFPDVRLAAHQLLKLADETSRDDDLPCPITPEDAGFPSVKHPELTPLFGIYEKCQNGLGGFGQLDGISGPFGAIPTYWSVVHGLLWALQSGLKIPRDVLAKLWHDESSMVESYVRALLEMSERLTPVEQGLRTPIVNQNLRQAIALGERILDGRNACPPEFSDREVTIWILQRSRQRLDALNDLRIAEERAKVDYERMNAVAEERSRNLSALAHTLHNALGTGPEIVRTAIRNLSVRKVDLTPLETKAVNDLASLYTTFEFVERLIQSFKLRVANPAKLSADMMAEHPDLPSMGDLVAHGLHQVIARTLFKGNAHSRFHLAGSQDEKKLKALLADFRRQMLLDENFIDGQKLAEWANSHLPGLRVSFSANVFCPPLRNHTQHALIFTVVSELLLNAVQHSGTSSPIEVLLVAEGPAVRLTIRNAFAGSAGKESIKIGSGGLSFIEELVDSLDVPGLFEASFQWEVVNGFFIASLLLTDERERQHEHNMGGRPGG